MDNSNILHFPSTPSQPEIDHRVVTSEMKSYTYSTYKDSNLVFHPQEIPKIPESLLYPTISSGSIKITLLPPMKMGEKGMESLCLTAIFSTVITLAALGFIVPKWPILGFCISGIYGLASAVSSLAFIYFDNNNKSS